MVKQRDESMVEVYNSLTREKESLKPIIPGEVSIYVCGVTPYAEAHLGHARPAVFWDVVKRLLWRRGFKVRHVQNFTDIDDKLVAKSLQTGLTIAELSARHITEYNRMMEELRVLPPDFAPKVTENIKAIIAFITKLIENGTAYASGGDVYFAVASDDSYGKLSGRQGKEGREGVRIVTSLHKHSAADFALWKGVDRSAVGWDSPWGFGRPGWHIECSAMSYRYLGSQFDLHGGGVDLIFPHHENEMAQSRAYFGFDPVGCWVHNGLVTQGQVKMSKSLGNGLSLSDSLSKYDPLIIRSFLLSVHYRTPLDVDTKILDEWVKGMDRIWRLWQDTEDAPAPPDIPKGMPDIDRLMRFEERFLLALEDDFNTARALSEVFEMVRESRRLMREGYSLVASGLARMNLWKMNQILQILPTEKHQKSGGDSKPLVDSLIRIREEARANKEFAWADKLRDILMQNGYAVSDEKLKN